MSIITILLFYNPEKPKKGFTVIDRFAADTGDRIIIPPDAAEYTGKEVVVCGR